MIRVFRNNRGRYYGVPITAPHTFFVSEHWHAFTKELRARIDAEYEANKKRMNGDGAPLPEFKVDPTEFDESD